MPCSFSAPRSQVSLTRHSGDRKSTRLNSSYTVIYTLSLHDALPIYGDIPDRATMKSQVQERYAVQLLGTTVPGLLDAPLRRSEEHTSELQLHRDLHSFPTRRSSDLWRYPGPGDHEVASAGALCRAASRHHGPRSP